MRALAPALALLLIPSLSIADLLDDVAFYDVRLGQRVHMGPVESKTIRGFEILYATPGAGDVSEIAGHLLLRVKLANNPQADQRRVENVNDLVISFLADTESDRPLQTNAPIVTKESCHGWNWFNLVESSPEDEAPLASIWQSLKGLSGGFRIIMDRQTLGHALKSYTIEQDRDLLRYRLNLTDQQQADLLEHLVWVKSNYEPKYYFFSQNCGSVLIKIIGQGIGDKMLADFDPWVSPPHTLLGNMVRSGLATREVPGFYSYRKQGFIAQQLFRDHYADLADRYPDQPWPQQSHLFHRRELVRANALVSLATIANDIPELRERLYRLAVLAQETEMVHSHKDWVCENYTSAATTEARQLQKQILKTATNIETLRVNATRLKNQTFAPVEASSFGHGSNHTELYPLKLGGGRFHDDVSADANVFRLDLALLKQDMGSPSRVAMQRQSAITLGGLDIVSDGHDVIDVSLTGLRLTKFRDTLQGVPSVFGSTRGLGLGLNALEFDRRRHPRQTRGSLVGVALLGNVISSANYNNYLYFSLGGDIAYRDENHHRNLGLSVPLGAESLLTLGPDLSLQWRNAATYRIATRDENSDELFLSSELAYRLGELGTCEFLLGLSVEYTKEYAGGLVDEDRHDLLQTCHIQINRW